MTDDKLSLPATSEGTTPVPTEQPKQNSQASGQGTSASESAKEEPKGFHGWVDTINKVFQILAIIVAGIWTYTVFQRTSAPNLETNFGIDSEIHWAETAD